MQPHPVCEDIACVNCAFEPQRSQEIASTCTLSQPASGVALRLELGEANKRVVRSRIEQVLKDLDGPLSFRHSRVVTQHLIVEISAPHDLVVERDDRGLLKLNAVGQPCESAGARCQRRFHGCEQVNWLAIQPSGAINRPTVLT